jgi:hypothetical protein
MVTWVESGEDREYKVLYGMLHKRPHGRNVDRGVAKTWEGISTQCATSCEQIVSLEGF